MIAKKNSRADLERRRPVFFQIGFLIAGSFTLAAFTYSNSSIIEVEKHAVNSNTILYEPLLVDPPVKVEPDPVDIVKPQEPKTPVQNPELDPSKSLENTKQVSNTKKLPMPDVNLPGTGVGDIEDVDDIGDDDIIEFPPVDAHWKNGGNPGMQRYINEVLKYPEIDRRTDVQGIVYVSFVVEKDGSVSNVSIERGVSTTIDREAERVVKSFPSWEPAENEFGKVRSRVRLPLKFILEY